MLNSFKLLQHQLDYVLSDAKYPFLLGGYGSGKTVGFCVFALRQCAKNPGKRILLAEPTYPMIRDVLQPCFEDIVRQLGFSYEYSATEMKYRVIWKKGWCDVLMRSAENYQRWAGLNLAAAGIDEADQLKDDRVLYRIRGDKDNIDILTEHSNSPKPTVLASPSLNFGVDLKGDASRFCIIIKCPWPDLGDVRVKEMSKNDYKWYTNKMFTTFIQQCGRCTRDENDYSTTYVIDAGGIRKLIPEYLNLLPTYFIDRFI